jgi:hypothetical protein
MDPVDVLNQSTLLPSPGQLLFASPDDLKKFLSKNPERNQNATNCILLKHEGVLKANTVYTFSVSPGVSALNGKSKTHQKFSFTFETYPEFQYVKLLFANN